MKLPLRPSAPPVPSHKSHLTTNLQNKKLNNEPGPEGVRAAGSKPLPTSTTHDPLPSLQSMAVMNLNLSRKLYKGDQVANFYRINNLYYALICLTF